MASEILAPCMMVERMSRPWLSVPRTNAGSPPSIHAGGLNAELRSSAAGLNGSCGEIQGDSAAPRTQMSVRSAATTVTGERRKLQARSCSQSLRRISCRLRRA